MQVQSLEKSVVHVDCIILIGKDAHMVDFVSIIIDVDFVTV